MKNVRSQPSLSGRGFRLLGWNVFQMYFKAFSLLEYCHNQTLINANLVPDHQACNCNAVHVVTCSADLVCLLSRRVM